MKKRSREIKLTLMVAAPFALVAGCAEPDITTYNYKDPAQCIADKHFTEQQCTTAFAQAKADTPRYEAKEDCENEMDTNCQSDGHGHFTPFFMGYMMGSNNSSGPIYSGRSGDYINSSGSSVGTNAFAPAARAGKPGYSFDAALAPTPPKVQTRTAVVSRGGFGGGRSFSAGG